ncbi:MAG: hypothetical protein ABIQ57_10620 [Candidatus Kapaibacterium sp.]
MFGVLGHVIPVRVWHKPVNIRELFDENGGVSQWLRGRQDSVARYRNGPTPFGWQPGSELNPVNDDLSRFSTTEDCAAILQFSPIDSTFAPGYYVIVGIAYHNAGISAESDIVYSGEPSPIYILIFDSHAELVNIETGEIIP